MVRRIKKNLDVDDYHGSTFSSARHVSRRQKMVEPSQMCLIISEKNRGFSAGNNLAIQSIKAPYTLFLNPDTIVPKGTISYVLDYLRKHSQVGAATCKVVLHSGKLDDGCQRGFPTPWNSFCYFSGLSRLFSHSKLFTGYSQGYKNFDSIHEIDSLTGAFMMLSTRVGAKLGWWDEDYFWNGEDLDFCYRIKQAGYKVMYLPKVSITHFKGASGGYKSSSFGNQTVSREVKLRTAKASTEAMRIFYQKHYIDKYPKVISWFTLGAIKLMEKYRISGISN
jgi:hypothetical protein